MDLNLITPDVPLDFFFAPRGVAVIGATEKSGSAGRNILWNLISSPFGGAVYPVNSRRSNVLGIKAYASIAEVPDPVDLAVIVTPAATVPGIVRECAKRGLKGAIVISAGFRETSKDGAVLELRVLEEARGVVCASLAPTAWAWRTCLSQRRPVMETPQPCAVERQEQLSMVPQPQREQNVLLFSYLGRIDGRLFGCEVTLSGTVHPIVGVFNPQVRFAEQEGLRNRVAFRSQRKPVHLRVIAHDVRVARQK
jgi:predicted CoA-binding protein